VNNAVNLLWGEVNGVGQNMLGVMLMELRAEFSALTKAGTPQKKKTKGAASPLNDLSYAVANG
jgi:hypothetical protein